MVFAQNFFYSRIIVVPSIPKGATGKISRKNVREVLVKEYGKTKAKAKL
jgi:acyl-coenzyme A synthetase/AMP-(fatty) acid ligase